MLTDIGDVKNVNTLLRKIFEYNRARLAGEGSALYTETLYHFYSSSNVIEVFKSRRMRYRYAEYAGNKETNTQNLVGKCRAKLPRRVLAQK
jgi:hypothetical protein